MILLDIRKEWIIAKLLHHIFLNFLFFAPYYTTHIE